MGFRDEMKEMFDQLNNEGIEEGRLRINDMRTGENTYREHIMKRHCINTNTSITLNDVLMTDLKEFRCVAMLNSPPTEVMFYRSYCTGFLQYGDYTLDAKFVDYDSGNIGVLSIDGDGAEELHEKILERQKRRAPILFLRKLIYAIYKVGLIIVCPLSFIMLFTLHVKAFFIGFLYVGVLRILLTLSRKYLR